ncbi:hypothetical protein OH77DRAFT_931272 [Trametes cingulata]|nr:hypothetical protein OH77DRAFT_931272 [Trametes cingulata]
MEHDWELLTMTTVRESGDCKGWFLDQATRLCKLPLDFEDVAIGEPISAVNEERRILIVVRIATALKFTTRTYLVHMFDKCGRTKPPPTLYFYERVHDYPRASLDERLDWPWGYWSTDPNDQSDIELIDDAHRARRHSIAFLGVAEDGAFRWMQIVEDAMFCIDIRYVPSLLGSAPRLTRACIAGSKSNAASLLETSASSCRRSGMLYSAKMTWSSGTRGGQTTRTRTKNRT